MKDAINVNLCHEENDALYEKFNLYDYCSFFTDS